eukprot:scaffold390248_cov29-Prasinocladus_malaysianus.AAC.1
MPSPRLTGSPNMARYVNITDSLPGWALQTMPVPLQIVVTTVSDPSWSRASTALLRNFRQLRSAIPVD